jgi:hypothetical protein
LFRDWQRTPTQSSATALRPEAANGCPVLRRAGTTSREAPARMTTPGITHCAFSRTRPGHLCSPLTVDSHGCRQHGSFNSFDPTRPRLPKKKRAFTARALVSGQTFSRTRGLPNTSGPELFKQARSRERAQPTAVPSESGARAPSMGSVAHVPTRGHARATEHPALPPASLRSKTSPQKTA